jgi:arginyl-tRNA synthetase
MINHDLADLVKAAIKKAQKKGDLPDFEIPEVVIGRPKQTEHGDLSTPVCMSMARLEIGRASCRERVLRNV